MEPIDTNDSVDESKPSAIKYCLFSACAACCTAVFIIIGACLVSQKRFQDFPQHTITIIGLVFMLLALVASVLAIVFKRMYKYYYDRNIITSHRTMSIRRLQVN